MRKVNICKILESSFKGENRPSLKKLFDEKITELGVTESFALRLLDMEFKAARPILDGSAKHPNIFNVAKLCDFIGISFEYALSVLLQHQDKSVIGDLQNVVEAQFLLKNFDLKRLSKEGFIKASDHTDFIITRILSFLGFESIAEYEEYKHGLDGVLFSKTKRKHIDKMRSFSILSAYRIFESVDNPNKYNREELIKFVPQLRGYSNFLSNGLNSAIQQLFKLGVTVIFQKHLTTSQFNGACFIVNSKPCIVLTDLGKLYPEIWLALAHELYHVLFDFKSISEYGYHLSGQVQLELINEDLANDFSRKLFLDLDEYKYIKPFINNNAIINDFAKERGVHPSIIYRIIQYYSSLVDGDEIWNYFHNEYKKYDINSATKNISTINRDKSRDEIRSEITKYFKLNPV